jgi:UDP-N-acetylglucosamine--N-acetylmuramyl-(pentapeptide) pyrophosphoryl-undecaprenol N-acetylglucosamine transferase
MQKNILKKILLTGGGTGGSVAPLLATVDDIKATIQAVPYFSTAELPRVIVEFLWIGTRGGPEKDMVSADGIAFKAIFSGKLRRYFSWKNFFSPFLFLVGLLQSVWIIRKFKPDLMMSAGGFVSVPVAWVAWLFRISVLIHQQDIKPGLANRLMAPCARVITVTFKKSLADYGDKAVWIGNPIRKEFKYIDYTTEEARKILGINEGKTVILVVGGGTGAAFLNNLVWNNLKMLTSKYQIIHLTGIGKNDNTIEISDYHQYAFLDVKRMRMAYDLSDIVISRCGLGVLAELSYLGKLAILIPLPNSHQEDNAEIYFEQKAAIVLDQQELTIKELSDSIEKLVTDYDFRSKLRNNVKNIIRKGANEKIAEIVKRILE